jgi:hypothetical protein
MNIVKRTETLPDVGMSPAEPLWKRAPGRDAQGRALGDFMMIIPRLKTRPSAYIRNTIHQIQKVFAYYENVVVFADLNLKLNVLWVTVKPIPGITLELAAAVKSQVPEAVLVANRSFADRHPPK